MISYGIFFQTVDKNVLFFRDAFDLRYSVGILRDSEGFDRNKVPDDVLDLDSPELFESDEEVVDDDGENELIVFVTSFCIRW